MNEFAFARLANQCSRGGPTIKKAGDASDSPGLSGVRVDDVRAFAAKKAVQLPNRHRIFQRDLATHLAEVVRCDAHLISEVAHIFFAFRNRTGDENRFDWRMLKTFSEPHHVLSRPTNIQASDNTNDLCGFV